MPIVSGKKRYTPETVAAEAAPLPVKRYEPVREAALPTPKKRMADGGGVSVAAVKSSGGAGDYLGAYEFDVKINMVSISFHKVSNISSEIELDTFVEGGNNDHPIIRKKPRTKPDILVLEKGMAESVGGGVFAMLKQGMRITNIMVIVKRNKKIARTYAIDEAVVISKKFSELDASASKVFIERLELAHNGISEVTTV